MLANQSCIVVSAIPGLGDPCSDFLLCPEAFWVTLSQLHPNLTEL